MNKKILALLLTLVMVLGSFTTVFAADFDLIHDTDSNKNTDVLTFSEDLDIYDQVNGEFSNYKIELDGKTYELVDVQAKLDGGAANLKDAVAQIEADEDGDLKVVSVSAINAKEVKVVFNKAVDKATVVSGADKLINVTFTKIGTAQTITSASADASLSTDGKTLTISANAAEYFDGQYAVLVPVAVTDVDGNAVEAYSSIVTLKDTVRPTMSNATYVDNNTAKFEFSEPIDLANGTALEGISTLKDKNGAVVSNTGLMTLSADKKSFTVNIAGLTLNDNYTLSVVGAKDYAGNLISPNPVTVNLKKTNADTVNPEVVSVEAINDTNLIVKFSEAIDTSGTYFTLDAGQSGSPVNITSSNATVNTAKTEVNVDLTDSSLSGVGLPFASVSGLTRVDIAAYDDLSGNTGAAYNKLVNFKADTDAPEVKATTVETIGGVRYIVVEFNEDVTVTPAALPTVTYVADGVQKTLTGGINSAAVTAHDKNNDGNDDSIKINTENYDNASAVLPEGAYKITLPANLVADAATNNNVATTVDVTVGKLSSTDTTKPVIQGGASGIVAVDNDTITVQFSEKVTNATALNVANYTVDGVKVFDSAIFDGDKTKVKLTLKKDSINLSGSRLVEVKNIADEAGNVMDTASHAVALTENVRPTITEAKLTAPNKVTMTFSEAVVTTSNTTDFQLLIGGNVVATNDQVTTPANATPGVTTVEFTLEAAVTAGDIANGLSLKSLSTNAIVDDAGNKLTVPANVTIVQ